MFDYKASNSPTSNQPVWDHGVLSAVGAGYLTTFSYSIVAEILRRGWFNYYSRLGLEPQPSARLVRQHQGRAYLNLSLSAKLEAEQGITPLSLRLNGEAYPLATVQGSFLSGILGNRKEKKVWSTIDELVNEAPAVRQKTRTWLENVQSLKWSQAEILQVMEQIERTGADSMMLFFAARHNLLLGLNQILWALEAKAPFPQSLGYLSALFAELGNTHMSNLIESDISAAVLDLAQLARNEQIGLPENQALADWAEWLPYGKFKSGLTEFLADHGHRSANESELQTPRWRNDPGLLLASILALANREATSAVSGISQKSAADLLQAVDAKERKTVQMWLDRLPKLFRLQSQALDSFAYILAGSHIWVQAAAQEAMTDGRLQSVDEAYHFQLEELKEMMTGEWNVSSLDEIRARLAERQAAFSQWQQSSPAPLLIGDQEVSATRPGLPSAADMGLSIAKVTDLTATEAAILPSTLVTAETTLKVAAVDCGISTIFPLAGSFIAENGHILDSAVAAAWSRKKVVVGE